MLEAQRTNVVRTYTYDLGGVSDRPELVPSVLSVEDPLPELGAAGVSSGFFSEPVPSAASSDLISMSTTPPSFFCCGVDVSCSGELQPAKQKAAATTRQNGRNVMLESVFIGWSAKGNKLAENEIGL